MVGYCYENDPRSKEWGDVVETISAWREDAREYKEKYEELLEKYEKLWLDYRQLWEIKDPVKPEWPVFPVFPCPSVDPYPWWTQPVITYTNSIE